MTRPVPPYATKIEIARRDLYARRRLAFGAVARSSDHLRETRLHVLERGEQFGDLVLASRIKLERQVTGRKRLHAARRVIERPQHGHGSLQG